MAVEEVHVVEVHTLETLVEAGRQILARTPVAVRSFPHVVSGFGGNEEFVAIGTEVILHQSAHGFFCTSVGRAVIVGKVEMGNAVVESIVCDGTASLVRVDASEVVPESQTDFRQQDSALAASLVESICVCVAIGSSGVDSFYVHIFVF